MRNKDAWQPSKYSINRGKLKSSGDRGEVAVGSRLIAGRIAEFYERAIPRHVRGNLIDLGCGKIPLYPVYALCCDEAICTDWQINPQNYHHLDFVCNLADSLPLNDSTFDTVILADVLEHLPHPESLWREMGHLLAPGGKLLLTVPFSYGIHEAPHDYYRFTEFALRRYAEMAGFSLLELEPLGGSPEVLADFLGKHLSKIPLIGSRLAILMQSITQCSTSFGLGKKLSHHTSHAFPLGYSLVAQKI